MAPHILSLATLTRLCCWQYDKKYVCDYKKGIAMLARIYSCVMMSHSLSRWDKVEMMLKSCKNFCIYYSPCHNASSLHSQSQRYKRTRRSKCSQRWLAYTHFCKWTSAAPCMQSTREVRAAVLKNFGIYCNVKHLQKLDVISNLLQHDSEPPVTFHVWSPV